MIEVVVGLLEDQRGRFLIAQRRPGTHMAGRWEFPGGKLNPAETAFDALCRELREELAVAVTVATPFIVLEHAYEDRQVRLDTWLVTGWEGEPRSCEGQALQWVTADKLRDAQLLEADAPIINALLAR